MIFEELKHLLPETITVIVDDAPLHHYDTSDDFYNYFEVTHIDAISHSDYEDEYEEISVVVYLKETNTVHYGNFEVYLTSNSESGVSAEQARGK